MAEICHSLLSVARRVFLVGDATPAAACAGVCHDHQALASATDCTAGTNDAPARTLLPSRLHRYGDMRMPAHFITARKVRMKSRPFGAIQETERSPVRTTPGISTA